MRVGSHLNLNGLQIQAPVLDPLASAPASTTVGRFYFDTALGGPRWYDGTAFTNKATDSVLHGGQTLAYVLSRGNQTGTQTAATISDLASVVQSYRLDQFAIPTALLNLNNQRITNLGAPSVDTDAATQGYVKSQVQANAAGIDAKASVRLALTTNDTLSGLAARDGITPVAGDRVLATAQTTASQNGVWLAAAGAWTRALDADENSELTPGAFWFVEEGTQNGKTQWRIENTGSIVVGTTSITINKFGAAAVYTASLGVQLVGSDFRSQVQANGGILAQAAGLIIDTAVVARKFSAFIGDGASFAPVITHNLGTQDVDVTVRDAATNEMVLVHWVATGVNTVTFTFNTPTAPAANSYRVTVIG